MHRLFHILLLFLLAVGVAQASCLLPKDCAELRECLNAPEYYCDCKENSIAFAYGMDTVLSSTTWYTAKLLDMQQGLTAYWFSTGSVQIDIFPLCVSDTALMSITIPANKAYNVTAEYITSKLETISGAATSALANMDVHIRVIPQEGVSGRVVMTSYNEGYHSTCTNPLPLLYNTAYVLSSPDNVYCLTYTSAPQEMAVQWIEANSNPVDVALTIGSCTAEAVATAHLTDSAHVWLPSTALLNEAYENRESVYFHFATSATGRVWFVSPLTKVTSAVDTTICQGMTLQLSDTALTQTVVYADTFYVSRTDSLLCTTYNLTVTAPTTQYDTVTTDSTAFPFLYRGQGVVNRYGNFTYLIHNEGQCDERVQLTVQRPVKPSAVNDVYTEVAVYPTVASVGQTITIVAETAATVRIYDILGNLLLEKTAAAGSSTVQLTQQGNYILQLTMADRQYRTHIIVK